jgi:hypothetical protein
MLYQDDIRMGIPYPLSLDLYAEMAIVLAAL